MQKMNSLYKGLIYDRQVSLSVLDTTKMVSDAINIHGLDKTSGEILGSLLTACAYMAGCLKNEKGSISITIKSVDGSATASVSGDYSGHIRGYIEGAEYGVKGGTMTVIKDDGFYRPFVGTCELKCNDVSENLMQYFHQSEQIPTAVAIGVHIEDGKCVSAGGVVMQLLPGTTEYNSDRAEEAMQSFVKVCPVLEELGADGVIAKYFSEELNDTNTYVYHPEYRCNCSRAKIEGVIRSLGKAEAKKIIEEDGKISVHCHYCNTDYLFFDKDLEELFGD